LSALDRALLLIKEHESGEFTEDPSDPGGPTRWGINLRFLREIVPGSTRSDIVEMTWARAAQLFRSEFWKRFGYDLLPDAVAVKVFDASVLVGPHQIGICLQRACRACGWQLEEDGQIGPQTRSACTGIQSEILLPALRSELAGFFRLLVAQRPDQEKYLDGWLSKRAYS
jgi:lysozyme family protein